MSDPVPGRLETRLDPDHPWPALLSFRESDQRFFGGRKDEVEALYRRIASSRLTLLFGLSGLGKTSLLRAGLFPRLRGERYFPVYIRLRFGRDLPTPLEQIKTQITLQAKASRIEAPEPREGERLWQYFHRADADFWDERNYPCIPVLVFDQFEELFTKSRDVPELVNDVVEELADLAEGTPPALMREAAERDRSLLRQVFEDRYRLLIGIRSDYLAQLQAISDRVRSVFANRYELHRMSGAAALESTLTAGGHLLDEEVARRVVRFVAGGRESDDALSVEGLEVEPALLSLVCSELNTTRVENGEPKITASMLFGTKDEILSRFYESSFADVSPELRELVEDKLVTRDGKGRNFISEQTARETPGVTEEELARLVRRRLLRFEESGSSRRMELTHDLLTAVAAASRSTREQRRQLEVAERARAEAEEREASARRKLRRSRAAMLVFFVLLLAAIAGPFVAAHWTATGAKKIEADSAFHLALHQLASEEPAEGLAYLARVIRLDQGNPAARTLLYQQLVTNSWPVPIRTFGPDGHIDSAVFNDDGSRIAFRIGNAVEMWDVSRGQRIGRLVTDTPEKIRFAPDGRTILFDRFFSVEYEQRPALWNPGIGRSMSFSDVAALPGVCAPARILDLSANGDDLALEDCKGLTVVSLGGKWPAETIAPSHLSGGSSHFAPNPRYVVVGRSTIIDRQNPDPRQYRTTAGGESLAAISRDGTRVLIRRSATDLEAFDFQSWTSVGKRFDSQSPPKAAVFDGSGDTVMTTGLDDGTRLWHVKDGTRLFDRLRLPEVSVVDFSSDYARILTASNHMARWWDAHRGIPMGAAIVQPKMLVAHLDGRGNITTVSTKTRVWELVTALLPRVPREGVRVLGLSADRRIALSDNLAGVDLNTGQILWSIPEAEGYGIDPQFTRALLINDDQSSMIDVKSRKQIWSWPTAPQSADFSDDGTAVLLAEGRSPDGSKGTITVVSAATGEPLGPPILGTGALAGKSRNGLLLALHPRGSLQVWHVRRGGVTLSIPEDENVRVAFSHDGRQLATVSSREGLRVWDIAAGEVRASKRQEEEKLIDATFSPDGRRLAVRSENGVALCDARSLDCGAEALTHAGVVGVEFSADGKRIMAASGDEVRVWDVETGQPLSLALPRNSGRPIAALAPDGSFVLSVNEKEELYRVPLPTIEDADAEILAALAEALAGVRVERLGITEPVDGTRALAELDQQCRNIDGPTCDIVRWLRTPAEKRTISPASTLRITDYVTPALDDAYPEDWWWLKAHFPNEPALGMKPPEE